MKPDQISPQEVRLFRALSHNPRRWLSNRELASTAKVADRTARAYTRRWAESGIVDVAQVFPAYKFRWRTQAKRSNASYISRLEFAQEVIP